MTAEYYGYDAMNRLTRIVVTDGTNLISDMLYMIIDPRVDFGKKG